MMSRRYLSLLRPGECGVVQGLSCKNSIRNRLQDLGMIEGTKVRCLQKSPLGDPTAFSVRGAVIALRHEDASQIVIL